VRVVVTTTQERGHGRRFEADFVVCTLPLGVLKKGSVEFRPPCPRPSSRPSSASDMGS